MSLEIATPQNGDLAAVETPQGWTIGIVESFAAEFKTRCWVGDVYYDFEMLRRSYKATKLEETGLVLIKRKEFSNELAEFIGKPFKSFQEIYDTVMRYVL
jgi:hypothetical protein